MTVHPLLWVVAALFVVYFAIGPIEDLLGISTSPDSLAKRTISA